MGGGRSGSEAQRGETMKRFHIGRAGRFAASAGLTALIAVASWTADRELARVFPGGGFGQTMDALAEPVAASTTTTQVLTASKFMIAAKLITLQPQGPPPPEIKGIVPLGSVLQERDLPLRTLRNQVFRSEKPNEYYYLPDSFRLARDPSVGYQMSALWTNDQKIKLALTLKADMDASEVAFVEKRVKEKYGGYATVRPLPYNSASIKDLEGRTDWQIDQIRIPSYGSLESDIPITVSMTPESFANLKAALETEGIGAGFELKSGDQQNDINIKISLRYPTGSPYSPLSDISTGFDSDKSNLVLFDVKNNLDFPITVDTVDAQFLFPGWSTDEVYKGLKVDPAVKIDPGKSAPLNAAITPTAQLTAKLKEIGVLKEKSKTDKSKDALGGLFGKYLPPDAQGLLGSKEVKKSAALKTGLLRYNVRYSPDFQCQPCLDTVWGKLEVATYIQRLRRIAVTLLDTALTTPYTNGAKLSRVTVDIKSPYFSQNPSGDTESLNSVNLTKDKKEDTSLIIYLPSDSTKPLYFRYRIVAVMEDGTTKTSDDWTRLDDTLQITVGTSQIQALFGPPPAPAPSPPPPAPSGGGP